MSPLARLRQRTLWYRYAWRFHLAHHPLCGRFERDVLGVGDLSLCRSCACAWAGLIATGAALLALRPSGAGVAVVLLAVACPAGLLTLPSLHARLARPLRDVARLLLGAAAAAVLALLVAWPLMGLAAAALAALALRAGAQRRASLRAHACDGCPELARGIVCSGYRSQARAVRAWEEAATRELLRTRY